MVSFTESERIFFTEMRAITTNSQGQEVLVGLTLEETSFYISHSRQASTEVHSYVENAKYLALVDKHEAARHGVLSAEIYLRNENPSRH